MSHRPTSCHSYCEWWKFSRTELIALGIGVFLMFAVRAPMLIPSEPTGDDVSRMEFYSADNAKEAGAFTAFNFTGRFTMIFVGWFLYELADISLIEAQSAFSMLVFIAVPLSGVFIARAWRLTNSLFLTLVPVLCITFHPYLQEWLSYKICLPMCCFMPVTILAIVTVRPNWMSIGIQSLLLGICLGAYQVFLNMAVATVLFAVVIETIRELQKSLKPSFVKIIFRSEIFGRMSVIFGSLCSYFFLLKCCRLIFGQPQHAYVSIVSSYEELKMKLYEFTEGMADIYFLSDSTLTFSMKFILIGLIGVTIAGLFVCRPFADKSVFTVRLPYIILSLTTIVLVSIIAPFISWFVSEGSPVLFRIVMMISVFWSGVFASAILCWSHYRRIQKFISYTVGFVLFIFILLIGQLTHNTAKTIEFDSALSNRIVADLEKTAGYENVTRLCLFHVKPTCEMRPLLRGEMNEAGSKGTFYSLTRLWAMADTINNRTGLFLLSVWEEERKRYREKYCGIPAWPAKGSIVIDGDTAVIRLP